MSWVRSLPAPLRAAGSEIVRRGWASVCELGAVGPDDRRGRRFGHLGARSALAFPQGALYNESYISIGCDTMVGPYVSLAAGMAPGQQMLSETVVRIGDRCLIGRGSHIVGHYAVELGDDIVTGPYVYITDQNHSYADPEVPVGRQWPVEARVRIGSGSWLGANAVVLPGSSIGDHVVVAAGAVVRGEVPSHCVVAGVPAKVVRRWLPDRGWVAGDDLSGTGPATAANGAADGAGVPPGADARS